MGGFEIISGVILGSLLLKMYFPKLLEACILVGSTPRSNLPLTLLNPSMFLEALFVDE